MRMRRLRCCTGGADSSAPLSPNEIEDRLMNKDIIAGKWTQIKGQAQA